MAERIVHLEGRLDDPAVRSLLEHTNWRQSPEHVENVVAPFRVSGVLLALELDDRLAGCIGLQLGDDGGAEIGPMIVRPEFRNQGIGRQLVDAAVAEVPARTLYAETDHDAVGFYRSIGFSIRPLGAQYRNVERFQCELRPHRRGASG